MLMLLIYNCFVPYISKMMMVIIIIVMVIIIIVMVMVMVMVMMVMVMMMMMMMMLMIRSIITCTLFLIIIIDCCIGSMDCLAMILRTGAMVEPPQWWSEIVVVQFYPG